MSYLNETQSRQIASTDKHVSVEEQVQQHLLDSSLESEADSPFMNWTARFMKCPVHEPAAHS